MPTVALEYPDTLLSQSLEKNVYMPEFLLFVNKQSWMNWKM